jgi:hypothetical protein
MSCVCTDTFLLTLALTPTYWRRKGTRQIIWKVTRNIERAPRHAINFNYAGRTNHAYICYILCLCDSNRFHPFMTCIYTRTSSALSGAIQIPCAAQVSQWVNGKCLSYRLHKPYVKVIRQWSGRTFLHLTTIWHADIKANNSYYSFLFKHNMAWTKISLTQFEVIQQNKLKQPCE